MPSAVKSYCQLSAWSLMNSSTLGLETVRGRPLPSFRERDHVSRACFDFSLCCLPVTPRCSFALPSARAFHSCPWRRLRSELLRLGKECGSHYSSRSCPY